MTGLTNPQVWRQCCCSWMQHLGLISHPAKTPVPLWVSPQPFMHDILIQPVSHPPFLADCRMLVRIHLCILICVFAWFNVPCPDPGRKRFQELWDAVEQLLLARSLQLFTAQLSVDKKKRTTRKRKRHSSNLKERQNTYRTAFILSHTGIKPASQMTYLCALQAPDMCKKMGARRFQILIFRPLT